MLELLKPKKTILSTAERDEWGQGEVGEGRGGEEVIFNCSEHVFGSIRKYLMVADAFWGGNLSSILKVAAREGLPHHRTAGTET